MTEDPSRLDRFAVSLARRPERPAAVGALLLAIVSAAALLPLAAHVDEAVASLALIVLAVVLSGSLVRYAARREPGLAKAAAVAVPVAVILTGALTLESSTSTQSVVEQSPAQQAAPTGITAGLAVTPSADLAAALDQADLLVPGGSAHLLEIGIEDGFISVAVLNPNTGRAHRAYRSSGSDWSTSAPDNPSDRDTFTRADVAGLDLDSVQARAVEAVRRLAPEAVESHPADGIDIDHRSEDKRLVATVTVARHEVEADMAGALADTVDAGHFDTALATIRRVLQSRGVDLRSRTVSALGFKAVAEGTDGHTGSHAPSDGGIAVEFERGPITRVVVEPGKFPAVTERDTADRPGPPSEDAFALSSISQKTLTAIRDDLMRRHDAPAYDRPKVGYQVGTESGGAESTVGISMSVGPSSAEVVGRYSLAGRHLGDGE